MITFHIAHSLIMSTNDYAMTTMDAANLCLHLEGLTAGQKADLTGRPESEFAGRNYCVTAWRDGKLWADAEGACNTGSERCTDAATATGMYD